MQVLVLPPSPSPMGAHGCVPTSQSFQGNSIGKIKNKKKKPLNILGYAFIYYNVYLVKYRRTAGDSHLHPAVYDF